MTATTGARLPLTAAPLAAGDLLGLLERHGDRPALVAGAQVLTHRDLAQRVRRRADALGPVRRLVAVEAGNAVEPVVSHLAALAGGHVVLLVAPGSPVPDAYDVDVLLPCSGGLVERRPGTGHDLHPDLALLLSTSGSTGSPKTVRLSRRNLVANARQVAGSLGLADDDRAVTTLPLHYCYGLSVLHSALLVGGSLVLHDGSVTDPGFLPLLARTGVTSLAGVPHTFSLLARSGFPDADLPALRRVTAAGGRLEAEQVRAFSELGQRRGWDLVLMYGQTEATARMAVLPPDLAREHPRALGLPVPGGAFTLEDVEDGVGELVYTGPNVMMGYAEGPTDLAAPPGPDVLRTGDLARTGTGGLLELVGRRSRFAKVLGLRVDLDRVEQALSPALAPGQAAWCVEAEGGLLVAAEGVTGRALRRLRLTAAGAAGLSPACVRAVACDPLPRTDSGKPRRAALAALFPLAPAADGSVAAVYADVLCRPDAGPDDTFAGLGGDSLSFVEASVRLEQVLGDLPDGWATTPVRDLQALRRRPRRGHALETGVALRALSILLVVGSHAKLFLVLGGAHLMLALAGHNLARFQLPRPRTERTRALLRSAGRVVLPSVVWVGGVQLLTGQYGWPTVALLNSVLGPDRLGPSWQFWYLEALVAAVLGLAALLHLPVLDRLLRRRPGVLAGALLAAALALRWWVRLEPGASRVYSPGAVAWLVALGIAAATCRTTRGRLAVSALTVLSLPGFFEDAARASVVGAGVLLVVWVRTVRVPALLQRTAGVLAGASLHVYLVQWQVYPHFQRTAPLLGLLLSLAAGLAHHALWERALLPAGRRAAARLRRWRATLSA